MSMSIEFNMHWGVKRNPLFLHEWKNNGFFLLHLILGVRSVFCVQKYIYFQTKWKDQLKYCSSLPTTFSHLSGNFQIPFRKNDSSLESIFDFCERSEPVTCCILRNNQNQKEQCPENTAGAVKHPIWAFPNIFLWL